MYAIRSYYARPQARLEIRLHRRLDVQHGAVALQQPFDRLPRIACLGLDHEHHRVVAEAGVGPHQQEQVGKAAGGDAEVGRRQA